MASAAPNPLNPVQSQNRVNMYQAWILCGLIAAILVNMFTPRSLGLVFVTFWYLLFVPQLLDSLIGGSESWFMWVICLEMLFATTALYISAQASRIVAAFSLFNIFCHIGGWISYSQSSELYVYYSFWLRLGESCQVLALILASRPVTQWIITEHLRCFKKKENHDGYRLAGLRS